MRNLILTFFLFLGVSTQAQQPNEILGHWECFDTGCQKVCEICCENEHYLDVLITKDSAHFFNYPHMYLASSPLKTRHDSIGCGEELSSMLGFPYPFGNLRARNDTLTASNYFFFRRTTFDLEHVALLRKDSIVRTNLMGKWKLKTIEKGYYGDPDVRIQFPFKLTPSFTLTERSLNLPRSTGRTIYLRADGVLRDFYIKELTSWYLQVIPGKWYSGNFAVEYRKMD